MTILPGFREVRSLMSWSKQGRKVEMLGLGPKNKYFAFTVLEYENDTPVRPSRAYADFFSASAEYNDRCKQWM